MRQKGASKQLERFRHQYRVAVATLSFTRSPPGRAMETTLRSPFVLRGLQGGLGVERLRGEHQRVAVQRRQHSADDAAETVVQRHRHADPRPARVEAQPRRHLHGVVDHVVVR